MTDRTASPRDVEVVRSEERLHVATVAVPTRRAVVRKVVVAEERTVTVTVRHEEFRLEYEPVGASASAGAGPSEPIELVLREEQVEVVTRTVPVERIRVSVQRERGEQVVTESLRAERIEVDGQPLPELDRGGAGRHAADPRERAGAEDRPTEA